VSFLDEDVIFAEADKAIHHFVNSFENVDAEAEVRKIRFKEAEHINIIIKTEDDEVDKVVNVKATVRVICLHFGVEEGQLLFNGEELDLDTTFDDNGIEDGATISFIREREITKYTKYEVGEYFRFIKYPTRWENMKDFVNIGRKYKITKITKTRVYFEVWRLTDGCWNTPDNCSREREYITFQKKYIMDDDGDYEYAYEKIPPSVSLIRTDEVDLFKGEQKKE